VAACTRRCRSSPGTWTIARTPTIRWTGLEILGRTGGSLLESSGTVEFRAMYRAGRHTGEQRENSKFVKQDGLWFYVGPVGA
jgi:SEC-C motif-containing protein